MSKSKLTWSAIIPLIGGFPLAGEKQLGKPPAQVIGYGFGNDDHYMNWLNVTNSHGIQYTKLDETGTVIDGPNIQYADIVVATPPLTYAA